MINELLFLFLQTGFVHFVQVCLVKVNFDRLYFVDWQFNLHEWMAFTVFRLLLYCVTFLAEVKIIANYAFVTVTQDWEFVTLVALGLVFLDCMDCLLLVFLH